MESVTDEIKTYVLAGYDHNGAFAGELAAYAKRSDVIIIRETSGLSIEDAVAQIKPPANVVLSCHGGKDAEFEWHNCNDIRHIFDAAVSYRYLFKLLPQGSGISIASDDGTHRTYTERFIQAVTNANKDVVTVDHIGSCYGGLAVMRGRIKAVPPGVIVMPESSETSSSLNSMGSHYASQPRGLGPIDQYIRMLADFDPAYYGDVETKSNDKMDRVTRIFNSHDADPAHAMPHMIGIGGLVDPIDFDDFPPLHTPLNISAWHREQNYPAWQRAKARVEKMFGTDLATTVIDKMQAGSPPVGAEGRRIGLAMAAAYMDESGEFAALMDKAKGKSDIQQMKKDVEQYLPHTAITHAPQEDAHTIHPPAHTPFVPTALRPVRTH